MAKKNKIQALLINYLLQHGSIDLMLPDGIKLGIGITQESKNGTVKNDEYCWVIANRGDRMTFVDRYSMSLNFDVEDCCMICENSGSVDVI